MSKKKRTGRTSKLTPKMKKFADTYIETGNATEAYKSAYATKRMSNETVNTEAKRTLRKPPVKEYIGKRMNQLEDAKIPKQKEILAFLGGVMRGTVKDHVITKIGELEVEPALKDKINAAKELLKRYPVDDPIAKAQLRKLNAEATLAESKTKESQDKSGRLRSVISNLSDKELDIFIENLSRESVEN